VFDETEGNPFFVEEVFRHLVEEGKVFDENGEFRTNLTVGELDVPESVRLVVGRRLERLGGEAQKVLAAGAVVGRGFPFSLLEQITEIDAGTLLDIVEEAEAARVIVPEERDGEVHYSFAHELIRQTLLSSISLLRRQRLHLTVANAIESTDKRAREERPSEIAHHLMEAGAAAEPERTLEYLDLAAARAMDAAAYEEALRELEDALSLVTGDTRRWTALEERRGWALRALGRFEDCLGVWDKVVDTYAELGDRDAAAALCREMSYQYLWLGDFDSVLTVNNRGLQILGDEPSPNRTYLLGGIGALIGLGGFLEPSMAQIDEAEAAALEFSDERGIGWAHWVRSLVYYSNTRFAQAIEHGKLAMEKLRATDVWTFCDAAGWTSLALIASGAVREAMDIAHEGDDVARKLGHLGAQILTGRTILLGDALLGDADLVTYEESLQADFERCRTINSPWIAQAWAWRGAIAQLLGRADEATGYFDEGIALEPQSAFTGIALGFKLLNPIFRGRLQDLPALLEEARPLLPDDVPASWGRMSVLVGAAHASATAGLDDYVEELYDRIVAVADLVPHTWFDASLTRRVAGMCALRLKRWDEAEEHFRIALRQAGEIPNHIDEPRIHYWYGRLLAERGRSGEARAHFTEALAGFRHMRMPLHVQWTEERLQELASRV